MGVTLIVAVMAAVGMSIARLEMRIHQGQRDQEEARLLAQSAVEFAVNWADQTNNWRSRVTNNVESTPENFGGGTIGWKFVDVDGDLADDLTDVITLYGYGRVGGSVVVESVVLRPSGAPLSCLEVALLSDSELELSGGAPATTKITSDQILGTNESCETSGNAQFDANVEAVDDASGDITGTATTGVAVRVLPGENVFDYYVANGTVIDYTSLEVEGSARRIRSTLLSPQSNPFGATNPEGIYVIDCQGGDLRIYWSRIVGTLVLLNAGSESKVAAEVHWEAAVANYPALLVQGNMSFDLSGFFGNQTLYEMTLSTNFNPPGTPYQGVEDTNQSTIYPSTIHGLVYLTGEGKVTDDSNMTGCIVAKEFEVEEGQALIINYSDIYWNHPPPGFANGDQMQVQRGSWKRAAYSY